MLGHDNIETKLDKLDFLKCHQLIPQYILKLYIDKSEYNTETALQVATPCYHGELDGKC